MYSKFFGPFSHLLDTLSCCFLSGSYFPDSEFQNQPSRCSQEPKSKDTFFPGPRKVQLARSCIWNLKRFTNYAMGAKRAFSPSIWTRRVPHESSYSCSTQSFQSQIEATTIIQCRAGYGNTVPGSSQFDSLGFLTYFFLRIFLAFAKVSNILCLSIAVKQ